ncbi:hypothetical protein [Paludisphaera rhizosphaerae]|uniref:hypothetical protein n=1 Tax=Paludisphaera rhizosphaerae TaxID=2711216 RepID=UPI0013EC3FD9|nr:hypothetical protein [Paludisphaera rhizosphaerae]
MQTSNRSRIAKPIVWLVLVALGAFGLSFLGFFPWSGLNCSMLEVDLDSGRTRTTRYLFWIPVQRTIADTSFTRVLNVDDRKGPPDWQAVNLTSPGTHHSPHFRFHGAAWQIRLLEVIWDLAETLPSVRRAQALEVRRLWRGRGNYHGADEYLASLEENLPPP